LIYAQEQPAAALAWSWAPRHLGARYRFIGWSPSQCRAQIHLLAYNTRFLILPWVKVPHLASHLLSRVARRIAADWQALYEHPVYLLGTFIDPDRFAGTCYRAANWLYRLRRALLTRGSIVGHLACARWVAGASVLALHGCSFIARCPSPRRFKTVLCEAEGEYWRWCPRCGHELHNEKCKLRCPRCHCFLSCSDFD
jgi:Druantia protein DruA